jgi:hypothetical protein
MWAVKGSRRRRWRRRPSSSCARDLANSSPSLAGVREAWRELEQREGAIESLEVRLDRIHSSLPIMVYYRLRPAHQIRGRLASGSR